MSGHHKWSDIKHKRRTMNISHRSWHYRLHNLVFTTFDLENHGPIKVVRGRRSNHTPESLCGYFWSTLLLTLLSPFLLVFLGILVVVFYVLFWPWVVLIEKRQAKREALGTPPKPNLIASFVRAKKQKVCPRITVI